MLETYEIEWFYAGTTSNDKRNRFHAVQVISKIYKKAFAATITNSQSHG